MTRDIISSDIRTSPQGQVMTGNITTVASSSPRESVNTTTSITSSTTQAASPPRTQKHHTTIPPGITPTGNTTLTAQELRRPSVALLEALEEGRVFAVQEGRQGRGLRSSRMCLVGGGGGGAGGGQRRLYLGHLQDAAPPAAAITIQHTAARTLLDRRRPLVFLDLAGAEGTRLGRVHVRLRDSARACQFLWLCMGQQGPSYAGSSFLQVRDRGGPRERLLGGDYDGIGGKGLVPWLGWGRGYRRAWAAGQVRGWWGGQERMGQFFITTGEGRPGHTAMFCFGQVEDVVEDEGDADVVEEKELGRKKMDRYREMGFGNGEITMNSELEIEDKDVAYKNIVMGEESADVEKDGGEATDENGTDNYTRKGERKRTRRKKILATKKNKGNRTMSMEIGGTEGKRGNRETGGMEEKDGRVKSKERSGSKGVELLRQVGTLPDVKQVVVEGCGVVLVESLLPPL